MTPPPPAPAPDPFLVPLLRTSPEPAASSPDLETLAGWLDGARVVGLGEDPHGVDDFHRLGHRIFEHLARTAGFEVYALEINQAHAARLDQFVQGEGGDLDALLAERWWVEKVFYDRALRDILLALRELNRGAARPVHVAGYDFKHPGAALAGLRDGLGRLDSAAGTAVADLAAGILELGGLGVFPNTAGWTGELVVAAPPAAGPRRLALDLRSKARGMRHGTAGALLAAAGPGVANLRETRTLGPGELGESWTRLHLELELPAATTEIRLALFHRGNGEVWFEHPSLELDGQELLPDSDALARLEPRALLFPALQVMDYSSELEPLMTGPALRVRCSPAVDLALTRVAELEALVEATLAARPGAVGPPAAGWLRQQARLVRQAVEWRTLAEPNRDVFLAENAAWLEREAFPAGRLLLLGHTSHTERLPARMGGLLDQRYGPRYKTVSMLAASGTHRDFANPRTSPADAELTLLHLDPETRPELVRALAKLAPGNHLTKLAAAPIATPGPRPEVAILVREVEAIEPMPR